MTRRNEILTLRDGLVDPRASLDQSIEGVRSRIAARVEGIFSLELPLQIAGLRDEALALHQAKGTTPTPIPELVLIDVQAWAAHSGDEDWLIWRARRCADRLAHMPLDLESGERIVGKPRFRDR